MYPLHCTESQKSRRNLLVHCLDGVDKCGLFLAAFNLLQKRRCEEVVDVAWSVSSARDVNQRFVSGSRQLQFLFKLVQIFKKSESSQRRYMNWWLITIILQLSPYTVPIKSGSRRLEKSRKWESFFWGILWIMKFVLKLVLFPLKHTLVL